MTSTKNRNTQSLRCHCRHLKCKGDYIPHTQWGFFSDSPSNSQNSYHKASFLLQAGWILGPESHAALTPTAVLDLCDKQSFTQSHYFLCQNATCEDECSCMINTCDTCEKSGSARKVRRRLQHKFLDFTVSLRRTIHRTVYN
jgi:hypothetical protein